ncbi:hypothetical protein AKO1_009552 [Acrasis kona]|uniref:Uncharacterized protein n=1 Tax=Acrasis kona TaxID=1008807 RepID=A0AAW2ZLP9_9EUKA
MSNPVTETHLRPYDHNGMLNKQSTFRRTPNHHSINGYYKQNSPTQRRRNFPHTNNTSNSKFRPINPHYSPPVTNNVPYQNSKKYNSNLPPTQTQIRPTFDEPYSNNNGNFYQRQKSNRLSLVSHTTGKYKNKQLIYNSFVDDKTNIYRFFRHSTPYLECEITRTKGDDSTSSTSVNGESNDEVFEDAVEFEGDKRTNHIVDEQSVIDALTSVQNDDEDEQEEYITKARYQLSQLWNFYDQPYGLEVPFVIRSEMRNVYFVPHLSALQLFHEASQIKPTFEFYETSTPDLRFPLIDKIEELSIEYPPLMNSSSSDLDSRSWYSIAWYPILCHNDTMNWMKGQLITYHHFEPHDRVIDNVHYFSGVQRSQSMEEALHESCMAAEGRDPGLDQYYVPIIGFLPYKIRNDTWFMGPGYVARNDSFDFENEEFIGSTDVGTNCSYGSRQGVCLQAPLYLVRACKNMMYEMQINHPDYQHVIQNFRELAQV